MILIYGTRGWIGGLFTDYLKSQCVDFVEGTARLEETESLETEIKSINPTHVCSFTGRTHGVIESKIINSIDYLEYPGKLMENVRDNLFGPVILAKLAEKYGFHYTYLGTGCIFNGDSFTEESLPNYFGSSYSIVKGFTDQLMHHFNVLNLRIRMPISSVLHSRNFITKITKYSQICSIPNSMTVLDDFFPIFLDMMLKKKTGTYNCTNPGTISHNEILEEYKRVVDPTLVWENITLEQQKRMLLSDRSNNELDTTKLTSEYNVPTIKESVFNIIQSNLKYLHENLS
jgi:dTDP-4-dehydrorhamnose reductase